MKALFVAVAAFFTCWSVLTATDTLEGGNPAAPPGLAPGHGSSSRGAPVLLGPGFQVTSARDAPAPFRGGSQALRLDVPGSWPNPLAIPVEGFDREESRFRRFEIVFFTSLPASVLFSLLGVIAFRTAAGGSKGFSSVEYRYLALSTVGISLALAARDSRNTYGDKIQRRGHR